MNKRALIKAVALVFLPWLAPRRADAADPIVVGRSLALSGPLQGYGEAKRDGGDAYIQKVNAAGGVHGRSIKLVTLDDQYTPAKTVENLKRLAADSQPVAYLGLFGVPTVAAALPVLSQLRIPAVGLTSGTDALRTPLNRYVFPVRASYADEARKLVSHVETVRIGRIAVIYSDNPFGQSVKDTLLTALKGAGLSAEVIKVDPSGSDAEAAARQAIAPQPQAVFLTMLSQAAIPVLKALKGSGYHAALYTFSPVDTTAVTNQLGERAHGLSISQVVPIPSGVRVKAVAEYIEALKALGRGAPSFYGLDDLLPSSRTSLK